MTAVYLSLLGVAALLALEAVVFPYRKCPACNGGKRFSPITEGHWRDCPACKGKGKQLRLLARLFRSQ